MLQSLANNQSIPLLGQFQLSLLRRTDMIALCDMLNDDRVNQFLFFAPAADSFYYDYFMPLFEQLERSLAAQQLPQPLMVAIRDQQGEFAGMAALLANQEQPGTYDVGYQLPASSWGQGLATSVCKLLTKWAFEHYGATKVQADTYDTNQGSKRVLEKSGFGRSHKDYRHFEQGIDRCWFNIDRTQWQRSNRVATI